MGHNVEVNSLCPTVGQSEFTSTPCPMPLVSSLVQSSLIDRFLGHSQFTSALCPMDKTEARNTNTNRGGQDTLFDHFFRKNCMKMKKFWVYVPRTPPRSETELNQERKKNIKSTFTYLLPWAINKITLVLKYQQAHFLWTRDILKN